MDILAGHLLGDCLLQNRWLARLKSKSSAGVLLHSAIVALSIALFTGWWGWKLPLVLIAHALVDGLGLGKGWPDLLDQGNPQDDEPAPMWLRLVMDQAMHIVSYAVIARLSLSWKS